MSLDKSLVFCLIGLSLHNFVRSENYKNNFLPVQRSLHRELTKNQFDHVNINHQNITEVTKELLWELTMVKRLEIENCNVRKIEEGAFGRLQSMKRLSLKHNLLEEIKSNVFDLPWIEELDLSDNKIRVIEDRTFQNVWSLRKINLRNNKIEVIRSEWFYGGSNLCSVNLENNLIKSLNKESFRFLYYYRPCYIDLILSYNQIEKIDEDTFSNVYRFDKLYLDHNLLVDVPNKTFSVVVKDLRLDHNKIFCIKANMEKVENFNVDGNPWNERCLLDFKEQKNLKTTTTTTTTSPLPRRINFLRYG